MYKGKLIISEDQGEVALLFCDICDFDKIVVEENAHLINFLDSIFRSFDQFCFNFKIQKIETVGKTYMACAGLKEYEYSNMIDQKDSKNSTTRILELAIEMMRHAQLYKWGSEGKELKLKIGINYGPVLAGVIGFHKPQFSLIGDTVNTTSRVCSTGDSGHIILSESAYKQLEIQRFQNSLQFVQKEVEAKGKGTMKTFQVEIKILSSSIGFYSKVISQASPKHSFFNSPKHKVSNSNFGFSEVISSNEDMNRDKNKSFGDISTKLVKSSDEISHTNFGKLYILNNTDVIKESAEDLISSMKKLTKELSSKNDDELKENNNKFFGNENSKKVNSREESFNNRQKNFLKSASFVFDKRMLTLDPKTKMTKSLHFSSLTSQLNNSLFVHQNLESENIKSLLAESEKEKQEALFIPLEPYSEKPSLKDNSHKSCIDLIKLQFDESNQMNSMMMLDQKMEKLKDVASLHTFQEEEKIEEFYEFVEKKPQCSMENNNLGVYKKNEDMNLVYEGLKDVDGDSNSIFLKAKKFWLIFINGEKNLKKSFQIFLDKTALKTDKFILSFLTLYCIIITLFNLILQDKYVLLAAFTLTKMAAFVGIILLIFFENKLQRKLFKYLIIAIYLIVIILIIISYNYNLQNDPGFSEFAVMLIYCSFCQTSILNFIEILVLSLSYLIFDGVFITFHQESFQKYFITLSLVSWLICNKHMKARMELDLFNKERILEYEKKRLNEIVRYLLPPHVKIFKL